MSDYTDIQPELDDFENAVYGEEVRDSMVSAIKKIYDIAESAAGAPDASTATAGQAPIADGQGGWAWGDVETGDSVPTNVRQAILALFQNGVYTRDDMSDEVAVVASWASEVTSISVSPTTLNINGMNQQTIVATTQPSGGIVTWSSSDESIATVSGGVVTPTGVNGTCTITASCGGKLATCAVTVSGFATLLSITATYTQSGAVYDTDTLDSLKEDLVVTANYDDDRSVPVTDYTLSGTLAEGTSTITVSYGGKTATFSVTVTAHVYTRSDYAAQDKMLLWLDGIDNTTAGHNVSSTIWEDLSGNGYNVTYNDVGIISDDHYNPNGKGCSIVTMSAIRTNIEAGTVEVVMKGSHDSASHVILPFGNTRGACIISSNAKTPPYVCLHPNTEGKCFETTGAVQTFNSLGYVDGVVGTPLAEETGGTWATYMMNLIFCYKNTGNYPANSDVYAIRIYDKELTAEEIALNAAVDRSRFGGS